MRKPDRKALLFGGLAAIALVAAAIPLVGTFRRPPPELRAGYNRYVPFVMPGSDGHPTGLGVEIVSEAAKRAGVRMRWVPCGDAIDEELRRGKIDFFPMLTLTRERAAEFHVSQPWWENEAGLISLETRAIGAPSAAAGKRIAIRGLPILKTLAESVFPRSVLVTVPKIEDMVNQLCRGQVDAVFLDLRLLQSQLFKGPAACVDQPIHVISVPGGSLSQGSAARKEVSQAADRIYEQIAELALDGTLSETASRWSLVSSFQNRQMKDTLDAQQRARLLRYGLMLLTVALLVAWFQNQRIRGARRVADESRQRFDAFMKHTPAITFISDETGRVVYVHEALSMQFKLSPRDLADRLPRHRPTFPELNRSVETTETVTLESGEQRHFLYLKFPFASSGGRKLVGSVALDITERRKAEEALRFSQFSIERSPDSILWVDSAERIFYANQAACTGLGYSREELYGLPVSEIYASADSREFAARRDKVRAQGSLSIESAHRARDGSVFPVDVALYHLEFDGSAFTCCISRDITERKLAERELAHQAQHDLLTGLPNRRLFESRLAQSIGAAEVGGTGLGLFYFDLDAFKLINDTLGHAIGDAILKQLVRRIEGSVRQGDTLARMGGDEFILISPGIDSQESARLLAGKLLAGLHDSFAVDGHELLVTASVGISIFPIDGRDGTTLLRHADAAMYEAKRQGKNLHQFFNPAMNAKARERLELENNLRRALERGELSLHYQPQISFDSGEVVRYEALLRWNSQALGSIPPAKFIPIAEETGLIVPIGAWVLEEACRHAKRLFESGSNTGVGVNVSNVQFGRADFVATVVDALAHTALPPCLLELELTESVVMQGVEDTARKIAYLRGMGVSISIDDFGTGYSSLSYLQTLRIDSLKIDRSFIRDIPFDANALSLTQALVSLAHGLGMKVVVEGLENRDQFDAMRKTGCDLGQGYLLGRPAPAALVLETEMSTRVEQAVPGKEAGS